MARIQFRFLGLRRSGNHGLITWVLRNAEGENKVFFNNCRAGKDPFVRFPQAQLFGRHEGTYQKKNYIRLMEKEPDYLARVDGFHFSYEDVPLTALDAGPRAKLSGIRDTYVQRNLFVLRDFSNWTASFWPHIARQIGNARVQEGQPLNHVAEFLRMCAMWKDNIKLARDPAFRNKHNITVLRYDDWTADPDYRRGLLQELGLPGQDAELPEVSTFGGGSSFDGLRQRSDPNSMNTSQRWRMMIDQPQFRHVIEACLLDEELCAILAEEYPDSFSQLQNALTGS